MQPTLPCMVGISDDFQTLCATCVRVCLCLSVFVCVCVCLCVSVCVNGETRVQAGAWFPAICLTVSNSLVCKLKCTLSMPQTQTHAHPKNKANDNDFTSSPSSRNGEKRGESNGSRASQEHRWRPKNHNANATRPQGAVVALLPKTMRWWKQPPPMPVLIRKTVCVCVCVCVCERDRHRQTQTRTHREIGNQPCKFNQNRQQ